MYSDERDRVSVEESLKGTIKRPDFYHAYYASLLSNLDLEMKGCQEVIAEVPPLVRSRYPRDPRSLSMRLVTSMEVLTICYFTLDVFLINLRFWVNA